MIRVERCYRRVLGTWKNTNKEAAIDWAKEHPEVLTERVFNLIVPKN